MQQKNDAYLTRLWLRVLLAAIPALIGIVILLMLSPKIYTLIVLIITPLLIFAAIHLRLGDRHLARLFRSQTPEPLLKLFNDTMRHLLIPDKEIHLAFSRAFIQMLYGNFEAAKIELDTINPNGLPPIMEAVRLYHQAILDYLYYRNYEQGLQFAKEARQLLGHSKRFPTQSTSLATYDAYIEIGEVLVGNTTERVIKSLEAKAKQLSFMNKPLILWALEIAYIQMGEHQRASEISALRLKLAPYCRGLTRHEVLLKK